MRSGIVPEAVRDILSGGWPASLGHEPGSRPAPLEDEAFDALVAAVGAAQTRPLGHGSRIVLTLFGFGIVPRRVTVPAREDAKR